MKGAPANALPDQAPEAVKQDRHRRFIETAQAISAAKLAAKLGARQWAILDDVARDGDGDEAMGRAVADAPEIDGQIFVAGEGMKTGDIVEVEVTEAGDYDLWGDKL